jgi:sensor c-di-GMP phosphodiesterase-like protein
MTRTLWALAIIAGLILAGLKAFDWAESAENERFDQREQMVRKVAEDRAAGAAGVLEAGQTSRVEAITREVEAAQRSAAIDSLLRR